MAWDITKPGDSDKVSASYSDWVAHWDCIEEWSGVAHVTVSATDATSGEHYMGRSGFFGAGTSATYGNTSIYTSAACANSGAIWYDTNTKAAIQLVSNGDTGGRHYFSGGEVTPTSYKWSAGHAVLETETILVADTPTQVLVDDTVTTSGAFDILGEFISNTFTVVNAGYYLLTGRVKWRNVNADEEQVHYIWITVDGSPVIYCRSWDEGRNVSSVCTVLYLTAAQAVKLYAFNGSDYGTAARTMREASLSWARLS